VYDAASLGTALPTVRNNLVVSSLRNTELCLLFTSLKIEKNEMGWACSSDGGGERCAQDFGGET
jgi:hypothetical protein